MLTEEVAHRLLRDVWMEQAVMRESDRSRVFDALMKDAHPPSDGTPRYVRASLKPAIDEAVSTLVAAFSAGPPPDPVDTIWRAFPRLDKPHLERLAQLLIEARVQGRGLIDE